VTFEVDTQNEGRRSSATRHNNGQFDHAFTTKKVSFTTSLRRSRDARDESSRGIFSMPILTQPLQCYTKTVGSARDSRRSLARMPDDH
jgi:hypothetical protein